MAKKKDKEVEAVEIVEGTQEWKTREFLAREKAAYEERTGETVKWELDAPLTSTPIAEPVESSESSESFESAADEAGGEG